MAVFGCGPVGLAVIVSARLMGAGRIIAVDHETDRLDMARRQGAEVVNFDEEDPVETILALTGGIGPDRVIDAVGVDAEHAQTHPDDENGDAQDHDYKAGDAPSKVLEWAVQAIAKAGTLSIIGVYPPTLTEFPIGQAMNKNLTIRMGNCNHRKYVPQLLDMVAGGVFDPVEVLTDVEPMQGALDAYAAFDQRKPGWIKVELKPQS